MVSGRIQTKERNVGRVRNPGQRVPVAFVKCGRGPANGLPGQARLDVGIFRDVPRIVVVYKAIVNSGKIHSQSGNDQQKRKRHFTLSGESLRALMVMEVGGVTLQVFALRLH